MVSANHCGLEIRVVPTMSHWIIMIDFYYMESQFILLNNKQWNEPRGGPGAERGNEKAATSVAKKRSKNLNEKL